MPIDPAHVERVENEKDQLRLDPKLKQALSYDEAVFEAAKPALKDFLKGVCGAPTIPESSALWQTYRAVCLDQIRIIVDSVLCELFAQTDPMFGHVNRTGKRYNVVSAKHDLLVPRAKRLVGRLDGRLKPPAFKHRRSAVLLRTADEMNTANWPQFAKSFYSAYVRDQ